MTILVTTMKVCALAALAAFCLVALATPSEPRSLAKEEQPELAAMLKEHHCVAPSTLAPWRRQSAIIRTQQGELRHVTLDIGSAVEQGRARGELIAFCADPAPAP